MKQLKHSAAILTTALAATALTSCSDREDDIVSTENSDFHIARIKTKK